MSGVTIGRVVDIEFDGTSLEAVVTFVIDSRFDEIPDDSDASILTAGLLGSQYIGLQAGGSETYLVDGYRVVEWADPRVASLFVPAPDDSDPSRFDAARVGREASDEVATAPVPEADTDEPVRPEVVAGD